MPIGISLISFAVLIAAAALWVMLGKMRDGEFDRQIEDGRRERVAATAARIERLEVPPTVMLRAQALLAEKGVQLDDRQKGLLVQGFKDFLVAVVYNRYIVHADSRNHAVSMTSDTVDMLWHAWLEDAAYEKTFMDLLGFALLHVPEDPEKVAEFRGEGKLDFLRSNPHARAAETYQALQKALPLVKREAYASALYSLDKLVRNPQGFYYTNSILLTLGQTDIAWRRLGRSNGAYAPGSNCGEVPPPLRRRISAGGASPWSCSGGCTGHSSSESNGGSGCGAGHGCSSGGSCSGGH